MLQKPLLIAPSADFWSDTARALLVRRDALIGHGLAQDWSALRVLVPTFAHGQQLKLALAAELGAAFIPPRIGTLSGLLGLLPPDETAASSRAERLMSLYAGLRQHGWLKKMFSARRNTDLLPLAQMLLDLSDELTAALLPSAGLAADAMEARWQAALAQLSPAARKLLSDEAQLVWSIWKSQLDGRDAGVQRYRQMLRLAASATESLVWIGPAEPDVAERAFLQCWGERQPVLPLLLDWRQDAITPALARAWPELSDEASLDPSTDPAAFAEDFPASGNIALYAASSLEDEATHGARTILDWMIGGRRQIAVIAQDRVVARRLRALLDRAGVTVMDETGWKLSTTRAAAALAAWLELLATRGDTDKLLDFLKSPYVLSGIADKTDCVLQIELALRVGNVQGGWHALDAALASQPQARSLLQRVADQGALFTGRKSLPQWVDAMHGVLDNLDMRAALAADAAGIQVVALLDELAQDCLGVEAGFSFPEWRAFLNLQLESTAFTPPGSDRRVVMLPLNGARLRSFDAVLLVGADAGHLPSQQSETLFFANAVRRELDLSTRESRQRQQLRDFAELLMSNRELVLSWQSHRNDEPNPVSPWIARLQLVLERAGHAPLAAHQVHIESRHLRTCPPVRPQPVAPALLPAKLSASGYNSLVACPYQFFAGRMLRLAALDELSDLPEKRDYGDWLHRILKRYHDTVREQKLAVAQRATVLNQISEQIFNEVLDQNPAALGYFVRWQKVMPAYLEWANQREAQGWQFEVGERWAEKTLSWETGSITLHGRVDRIDRKEDGDGAEFAVLDYKTTDLATLRKRVRDQEDHQLAFYGLLLDEPISEAAFVSLDAAQGKGGAAVAPDFESWQRDLQQHIVASLRSVQAGVPLPANGVDVVCQYCAVRGLCRKGSWS